jgi:hypothetical protein
MANGRCRMHGGLSTGPRTAEGLARSRRARWRHGARSVEVAALRRAARTQLRRVRTILSQTHRAAGHGVHRSKPTAAPGMSTRKIHHRGHRDHRETVLPAARAARIPASSVNSVSSVVNPSSPSAGHGVHRSAPQLQPVGPHLRSSAAKSSSPAGHGVLRSFRDRLRASASLSTIHHVLNSAAPTNR